MNSLLPVRLKILSLVKTGKNAPGHKIRKKDSGTAGSRILCGIGSAAGMYGRPDGAGSRKRTEECRKTWGCGRICEHGRTGDCGKTRGSLYLVFQPGSITASGSGMPCVPVCGGPGKHSAFRIWKCRIRQYAKVKTGFQRNFPVHSEAGCKYCICTPHQNAF